MDETVQQQEEGIVAHSYPAAQQHDDDAEDDCEVQPPLDRTADAAQKHGDIAEDDFEVQPPLDHNAVAAQQHDDIAEGYFEMKLHLKDREVARDLNAYLELYKDEEQSVPVMDES